VKLFRALIVAAAVTTAVPAMAQRLPDAIASGVVGERFDGYMGFATAPTPDLRRHVNAINIKRRNLYIGLASGKNANAELVGMTAGCELLAGLAVGQAYMLEDGIWRRRTPGQPAPQPAFCR
jgi:uncharacterized protein YdbL (DUF1318 family)